MKLTFFLMIKINEIKRNKNNAMFCLLIMMKKIRILDFAFINNYKILFLKMKYNILSKKEIILK